MYTYSIEFNNKCRFLDPILYGEYPEEMQEILGPLLPKFSKDVTSMNGKLDFIGINHYTSFYSKDCIYSECKLGEPGVSKSEGYALRTAERDGASIGESVSKLNFLVILTSTYL